MIYLATIGSGSIVDLFLDAVEKTEGICCTAVYSRTEERAKEFAKKHGAGSWYSDLDAMLNDKTIDFIYVASPNSLHYDYVKRALTAGKHVICEKPFVGLSLIHIYISRAIPVCSISPAWICPAAL